MSAEKTQMKRQQEYVRCNLCNSDETAFLFQKHDFQIVQCKHCNLIYQNPRPAGDYLKEIYQGNYTEGYIVKKESKRRRARKIVRGIRRYKTSGNFLDIGSSAGFILEAARGAGFKPYGVEISPVGIKFAREELGLDIFVGFLHDAQFPPSFFDVVTLYHVIEHVPDPVAVFTEIKRILKDDGLLEIWTPDIGHWKARHLKENWTNIIGDHIYYFAYPTLARMLERVGLKVKKRQFTLKDGLKIYATKA